MDVMSSKEITEAIEKIKMELHPDDKSHFSFDKKERNSGDNEEPSDNELDSLWNLWEKLNERGIGDKSEEGQDLRDAIREYIDANELNVRVTRGKTNEDLLNDIEDALEVAKDGSKNQPPLLLILFVDVVNIMTTPMNRLQTQSVNAEPHVLNVEEDNSFLY